MIARLAVAAALGCLACGGALGQTAPPPVDPSAPPPVAPPVAPAPVAAPPPVPPPTPAPVPAPPPEGLPPAGEPLVAIDPGHGGDDPGAVGVLPPGLVTGLPLRQGPAGANLLFEKDVNLDMARRLEAKLRRRGIATLLTRTGDAAGGDRPFTTVAADLGARVDLVNQAGATLFVSIHANASRFARAGGTEVFRFHSSTPAASRLARALLGNVALRTGLTSRGVKGAGFYVLRHTTMPAVLVESAFLSNPTEAALLAQPRARATFADAIGDGIESHLAGADSDPDGRPPAIRYWVEVGRFRSGAAAAPRRRAVRAASFDAVLARRVARSTGRPATFVIAGQFVGLENAKRLRDRLRAAGLPAAVTSPA